MVKRKKSKSLNHAGTFANSITGGTGHFLGALGGMDPERPEIRLPERALWRAVILQAIIDAKNNPGSGLHKCEKLRAKEWLDGRHRDFEEVCAMAEVEPGKLRRIIQQAKEKGFVCTKTGKPKRRGK